MAYEGKESIEVDASPERLMEVVQGIEAYPDWMDAFRRAEVLERDEEGRPLRAEFEVDARIKVVTYILEYSYSPGAVSWKSVEGDVKQIDGSYQFEDTGGSSLVTYDYAIDPGFPVPGFLARQGVKVMVSSALESLKKRAES